MNSYAKFCLIMMVNFCIISSTNNLEIHFPARNRTHVLTKKGYRYGLLSNRSTIDLILTLTDIHLCLDTPDSNNTCTNFI